MEILQKVMFLADEILNAENEICTKDGAWDTDQLLRFSIT
jgi:hypothetical protein